MAYVLGEKTERITERPAASHRRSHAFDRLVQSTSKFAGHAKNPVVTRQTLEILKNGLAQSENTNEQRGNVQSENRERERGGQGDHIARREHERAREHERRKPQDEGKRKHFAIAGEKRLDPRIATPHLVQMREQVNALVAFHRSPPFSLRSAQALDSLRSSGAPCQTIRPPSTTNT